VPLSNLIVSAVTVLRLKRPLEKTLNSPGAIIVSAGIVYFSVLPSSSIIQPLMFAGSLPLL